MKKAILTLIFGGISSIAMAVPVCTTPTPDITSFTAGGGCTAGNLLFSNFIYTGTGLGEGPTALSSINFSIPGNVRLNLNPNQGNGAVPQSSTLMFNVSGLDVSATIIGTSSSNGGNGATTIHQIVCSGLNSIDLAGNCSGTVLQDVTNAGGTATPTNSFAAQSDVSVWRQVVTPTGTAVTGSSFDVQSTPEPVAFALMGSGLIGLALFRKRRKS
ncbi:MAG: PEP-CTERM sorting domain-containing protein [Bryobacteraceae bacterium]